MIVKIYYIVRQFVLLVLLQVLLLNNIQWSGYINPYVYVLFILLLPVDMPKWSLLLIGFGTGLIIDLFANNGGIHAAATTLIAFLRPWALAILAPRDGYEPETRLLPQQMGFKWFLTYAAILVSIHHLAYFFIEVFRFSEFFITFYKAMFNSVITLLIIFVGIYLFSRQPKSP